MSGIYKGDRPVRMIFKGESNLCKPYIKEARRYLQKYINYTKTNQLKIEVGNKKTVLSDGTIIIVSNDFDNPFISIDVRRKEEEEFFQSFQCDLFQDDPENPGDLLLQTKTPIRFNVVDPSWEAIPERHGNVEWIGKDDRYGAYLVSWDGIQNWGRATIGKRCSIGDNAAAVVDGPAWPYGKADRPIQPVRAGEINTEYDNYPFNDAILPENYDIYELWLYYLSTEAFIETNGSPEKLLKKYLFINNVRYDITFNLSTEYIMGSCVHYDSESEKLWCVVVTQVFRESPSTDIGIEYGSEEIYYFQVTDDLAPVAINIHTIHYNFNSGYVLQEAKSHLTPWNFSSDGLKGCALRDHAYSVYCDDTPQGSDLDDTFFSSRLAFLNFNYGPNEVTATDSLDTSVTNEAGNYVLSGNPLSLQNTLTQQEYIDWVNTLDQWYKDKSIEANIVSEWPFTHPFMLEWYNDQLYGTASVSKLTHSQEGNIDSVRYDSRFINGAQIIWEQTNSIGKQVEISQTDYIYRNEFNGTIDLIWIGGSSRHNIHFCIEVYVSSSIHTCRGDSGVDRFSKDAAYTIKLQTVCLFKGIRVEIGSPVEQLIPFRYSEDYCGWGMFNHINFTEYDITQGQYVDSDYVDISALSSRWVLASLADNTIRKAHVQYVSEINSPALLDVDDFAGTYKIAPDGTHAVFSCSYNQIAKRLYSWAKYLYEVSNADDQYVDRHPDYDSIGISQDQHDAWNENMLNYAIIESEENGVHAKQLSNLLFGKNVITEPDPISGKFEYGIKEKDTTAFMPIGLYSGE